LIARHWRGWTEPKDADAYESLLKEKVLPGLKAVEGYHGGYILRNDSPHEVEFVVVNLFDSIEAVKKFAGPEYASAVFEPEAKKLLCRIEPVANHYEVRTSTLPSQSISGEVMNLAPIGHIRSSLKDRTNAPRQATEGAPSAALEVLPAFSHAIEGLQPGNEIWILTWLHETDRDTLKVHPRSDPCNPLTGVFATRSPDRPNPIGLHRAAIVKINGTTLEIDALEAIDGTPVLDIKPVLKGECGR
jgi:tRNA-Thr(GGU) m(6)t(6)A37 methyltransferase TsaA